MKRMLILSVLILCFVGSVIVGSQAASADTLSATGSFKGSGTGQIVATTPGPEGVAIRATGQGVATQLGRFEREEDLLLNPATGQFTGAVVFTAANGDQLRCSIDGAFTSQATAEGTYTVSGGTGRFENETGSASFSVVQSDPSNFSFEFTGTFESN